MRKLSKLTLLLTALFTLSLASVPVYAKDGSGDTTESGTTTAAASTETGNTTSGAPNETEQENSTTTSSETHHGRSQNAVETASATNTDAKQKQCERREKAVETILNHIATRGQRQIDLFGTIATRVENFATTKDKQPSNYESLVAAVNTAHDNAVPTVATIKSDSTSVDLKCAGTSTEAKGAAATVKTELQSEISALQAYRTAVKNLIVGVKSVASTTNTSSTEGSN
jgi:hypothetical protein